MLGRVTLNPVKHLDPWGSVAIPLMSLYFGGFLIGWAKPCPVTLRNFKKVRRDEILVSLAWPASNLAIGTAALRLFPAALLLYYGVTINLLLFVFNLFPIPPLDGSHVLRNFLPYEAEKVYNQIGMYGLIVIFLLGGRFIAAFYYPLLDVFNRLLDVL